jgi:hypothetical protein
MDPEKSTGYKDPVKLIIKFLLELTIQLVQLNGKLMKIVSMILVFNIQPIGIYTLRKMSMPWMREHGILKITM